MGTPKLTDRQTQVLNLTKQGLTADEIAERLQTGRNNIYNVQARLKTIAGLDASEIARSIEAKDEIGDIVPRYREQSPAFRKWVRENMPEGCTVAEFAIACMMDHFHDDGEAGV